MNVQRDTQMNLRNLNQLWVEIDNFENLSKILADKIFEDKTIDKDVFVLAVAKGKYKIVELFLDNGASVNSVHYNQKSALITAVEFGHLKIVELLIDRGATVSAKEFELLNFFLKVPFTEIYARNPELYNNCEKCLEKCISNLNR